MANPAAKNAVLGRAITFGLSGQGASIAAYNRDLDTQITTWDVVHTIKTLIREPSGAIIEHDQFVSDSYEVTLDAEQVRSTFLKISTYQANQRKRNETVDLLHLTLKTVFDDGSSDVERYVNGTVQTAGRKGGVMSKPATSSIKIKFESMRDS